MKNFDNVSISKMGSCKNVSMLRKELTFSGLFITFLLFSLCKQALQTTMPIQPYITYQLLPVLIKYFFKIFSITIYIAIFVGFVKIFN